MPQVPGTPSYGQGGWGTHPGHHYSDRYDWLFRRESAHLGTSLVIGTIARNPYVSVGLGVLHGLTHVKLPFESGPDIFTGSWFREFPGLLGSLVSPGGGGPGQSLISTNPPLSLEATGAILEQLGKPGGPASSSKRGSRPRRKCKPGYLWNGHRCVPKSR